MPNANYTHTITLYNCLNAIDNPEKKEMWYRQVLLGCYYGAQIHTLLNGTQASQSNTYTVRIPADDRYLPYRKWAALTEPERAMHFTASLGDVVVAGECTEEITGVSGQTAAQVLSRHKPDAFKVTAFSDNTQSRMAKHYRLGG